MVKKILSKKTQNKGNIKMKILKMFGIITIALNLTIPTATIAK